jgi:diacylglycerol O-acyltransferase
VKQLSGLDAAFLYMETPTTYGHVNGLAIYQRPSDDFDPFSVVHERFGSLVGHCAPLRRRLVEVPFGLDHPYWIDDPQFDLLAEQVARIIGRPMDRRHPLWEVYVIEGLDDGHWAILTKTHHATIDGAAGVLLLKMFLDEGPDAEWPYELIDWQGEEVPSDSELLRRSAERLVGNPYRAARTGLGVVRNLADSAGLTTVSGAVHRARDLVATVAGRSERAEELREQMRKVSMPLTPAPPTPWNKSVGPHRRFAVRTSPLANVKALKNAIGGTVNDVVMAICAGALREYLLRHDALPDEPLRAMVPVSVRTGQEEDPWTNRVSAIVAELPTDCADPLERVARCRVAMMDAKQQLDLLPADAIMQATDTTSPVLATAAVRLAARLSDRVNGPVNVVVSNVPGPREDLYFAGAKLDHYVPVSTITNGMGLNITVHSYGEFLDFGLVADRDLVPDLWDLCDLHLEEIDRLFEATGAERPVPTDAPHARSILDDPSHRALGTSPGSPSTTSTSAEQQPTKQRSTAKKSGAKKSTAKKSTAKKSTAKQRSTAKKSTAKKSTAKKSTAKQRSTAKKSGAKKSTAKKSTAKQRSTAKKSGAKTSGAKKSAGKRAATS